MKMCDTHTSVPHVIGRDPRGPLTLLHDGAWGSPAQDILTESTADTGGQKTTEEVSAITQQDSSSSPLN